MKRLPALLLLLPFLLCAGCIPYHFTDDPGVKGRAIDARTHAPVAGARVTLLLPPRGNNDKLLVKQAATVADGTFAIRPKQHWGIYVLLPWDPASTRYRLSIDASGYATAAREFGWRYIAGPDLVDLGDIPLKRAK